MKKNNSSNRSHHRNHKKKKVPKIGLALGGGSAKGFAHLGVLKVLHKNKIFPDYIAGTSMGAVVGAAYATGHTPKEIIEIAHKTDWQKMVDFTIPKSGLLQGSMAERKLRKLFLNKKFNELNIPLRVVSFNLTKYEPVIFSEGDVAKAVRASTSIPGIFNPLKIGSNYYVDGGLSNPTPFDVVKEMGADIVIAVDLFSIKNAVKGQVLKEKSFMSDLKHKLLKDEIKLVKEIIFPEKWPHLLRRILIWTFDKIVYPARVLRMMAGKEMFPIAKVMNKSLSVLIENLAVEKLKHSDVDIIITPDFGHLGWADFDRVDDFVLVGEKAMKKKLGLLKKKLSKINN